MLFGCCLACSPGGVPVIIIPCSRSHRSGLGPRPGLYTVSPLAIVTGPEKSICLQTDQSGPFPGFIY